jgi:hypothetical protein
MEIIERLFVDVVSGKQVYDAICPCGKRWMIDSWYGFPFFKMRLERREKR